MSETEGINQDLIDVWEAFNEQANKLDIEYNISADEQNVQVYEVKTKRDGKDVKWQELSDHMFKIDAIKDSSILMKIDTSTKKGHVLYGFYVAAVNDEFVRQKLLQFISPQVITLNMKPVNNTSRDDEDIGKSN